jgi:phage terminase large subunit-like protein
MTSSARIPTRRPLTEKDPVSAFAWDVSREKVPACRLVRLAAARHFLDLEHGPSRGFRWRPELAVHVSRFFRLLRHIDGEWGGQRIELQPWQKFVVGSVFGWVNEQGLRRYRTVYEEIPRKSGKSLKLSGIGLYGLVADRESGAKIYSVATKRDQALLIFEPAQRMVRASPELRARVGIYKRNLSIDITASKFEPLSSDDKTLDGLNPHFVLIDELHKHRSRGVLDVMETALGARRQSLLWMITTAGDDNPESVYAHEHAYAESILERTIEDDSTFAYITTIDTEDRWDDPKAWAKANPNLGISPKVEFLEKEARKAKGSPAKLTAFKRMYLNVRTSAANRAVDMGVWAKNTLGPFDPASLHGRRCFGGLDLSSKLDLSAWVKLFPPEGEEDRWKIVARFWMPADTVLEKSDRDRVQYQRWIDQGWIEVTPGNVIDHGEIQSAVLEDCRLFDVASVAFDPWNAAQLSVSLLESGVPMVEFIQGIRSYNAPTKELDALLQAERLDHGNNPVLSWMANNLNISKPDRNENVMPSKRHSMGRIDGMTSLIMCIGRSMCDPHQDIGGFLRSPVISGG